MIDVIAERETEVFVGGDGVVRINVDGMCVARVKMKEGSILTARNDLDNGIGYRWPNTETAEMPEDDDIPGPNDELIPE